MRICVICPYSFSMPGGVQNQSILLSRQFMAKGHDVLLIAPGEMPNGVDYETYNREENRDKRKQGGSLGVKFKNFFVRLSVNYFRNSVRLDKAKTKISFESYPPGNPGKIFFYTIGKSLAIPANGSMAPVTLSFRAAYQMLKTIRVWSPDVVHIHEPFTPILSLVASLRVRKKSRAKPIIIAGTFHRSGAGRSYKIAGVLLRGVYARLDLCYAVSKSAQHTLAKVVGVRNSQMASVVFNGIDVEYLSEIKPYPFRDENIFEVCFVGRLEPRKGLEVLLKALVGLQEKIHVSILGTGAEMGRLQREYSTLENVDWFGKVAEEEKYARMKAADLLVAPALGGESFGVVVLEAMALGVPVVCSNIPGYRASAGEAALFIPPNDAVALREALKTVISDVDLRSQLATKGLLRAKQMSVANLAEIYLKDFADRYDAVENTHDV